MMLDSIDNGPLVYLIVKENWQTRPNKYSELTEAQQLQDGCDIQATNIILHGLSPDVYALVNHQEAAKDIWDRVKLLMKGTKLLYQERECRLYNLFDKFAYVQGDDLIECINKAMAFLYDVASRFPPSNNQLRTSSDPRNQATIQDGRVTVQQVQGRQTQSFASTRNRGIATTLRGNYVAGQTKIVKCYNFLGEGHMAKQYTQPKRLRSSAWFKEKLMLAKAVLMANLSSCDPDVLSEVPYSDSYSNDIINQDVQEMQYSEQTHIDDYPDNEINSDSNIIPYSQYVQESQEADKENQTNKMVNESLTAELERYKERVALFEQRINVDLNKREKLIDSQLDDLIRNRNAKLAAFQ
ncbi:hypothetical protein Tco_0910769 [Tanacetum coccineum]|uniref:Integrase, catalytic region, zinc finger, CCHC-type, peptidase aspartic, catalytic n=1 Tax=Tanacetum coccineum TaxID=301880 RepID=A0ABQ5D062_9ASTR